jgi:hypothetical protein
MGNNCNGSLKLVVEENSDRERNRRSYKRIRKQIKELWLVTYTNCRQRESIDTSDWQALGSINNND